MITKNVVLSTMIASMLAMNAISMQATESVSSPNGNVVVNFDVKEGLPVYWVDYKQKPVILESRLGLELDDVSMRNSFESFDITGGETSKLSLTDGFELTLTERSTFDDTWTPVWGEENSMGLYQFVRLGCGTILGRCLQYSARCVHAAIFGWYMGILSR